MDKVQFKKLVSQKIQILDGATGTELQKRGMPTGVCPEQWVIENPNAIKEIQKAYIDAGSNIIYTCTFGGNRVKLEEFGLGERTFEINQRLAQLSKETAAGKCLVAGDLASTGRFIKPLGDMSFEACVDIYKEQVQGLLAGGVDLFVIETMLDIQEARAALLAVKESCDLPVCVSMSFDESMRTLTGTDPVTALITLQSLGADAVGCNCSTGPEHMVEIITRMKPYARVPLMAKPNAGLPKLVNNVTVFDMGPEEFGSFAENFIQAGVNIIGGCCGTSPEYIKELYRNCGDLKPRHFEYSEYSAITSSAKTVFFGINKPVAIVGERINPTGKKKLQAELKEGSTNEIRRFALEQMEKGADILDVNVGMPGIDEKEVMLNTVRLLGSVCDAPLCLDSSSPEVLEAALRIYPGRALINSISQEKVKLDKLLPVAAKYGAMFILLPLNDEGVPEKAIQRQVIVQEVFNQASDYGYKKSDIVVDGLVMTVSSNQEAALETLKLIQWCREEFGCGTIVGLSNVSFGLPERGWVNAAFLSMAIAKGLTMAIANPSSDLLMCIKMACDVIMTNDVNSRNYISYFSSMDKPVKDGNEKKEAEKKTCDKIFDAVLNGDNEGIDKLIEKAIAEKTPPQDIVDIYLIPAINQVGKLFDEKKYFLPQLIQSAETMKSGFTFLEPLLKQKGEKEEKEDIVVVIATVKGDIHDIGKNIVGLMLRNYGFKVHDLGKDVSAERIIDEAKKLKAHIVGLSALMTTTMVEMEEVIKLAKEKNVGCKFMIGGAVVDDDYAKTIGADGYSKDAYEAVKLAKKLSIKQAAECN
ncbi:homocysteine S-methyltransferase [Ruminiclostridium papyrosolvens DSM 2782]|uniref:Methionine synthase n=1 Tax=Ruminiclostridium papyrosolvens DSM 2782 TaxID=588581 RepID=F1T967_9FIRM|nr:homocysteine S-methyltransferase family protein [Ruminiclostridium papyrosolvens]EGD49049.1 homocysteine S-methyltransferase [Ruminiclostridium papyrosolvens DSM 2782]WES35530.1 homocysteine S-methyltransferase family protein [Ruminiclostridium papyrosolvens DSM 2782]